MPIRIGKAPNVAVNWMVYLGRVTRDDLLGAPGRIDPAQPDFGPSWIVYVDGQATMSEIDLPAFAELKALYRDKVEALAAKGPFQTVLVSDSVQNDSVVRFWRAYAGTDPDYPSDPIYTTSLHKACEELRLNEAQTADVIASIRAAIRGHHNSSNRPPEERSGAAEVGGRCGALRVCSVAAAAPSLWSCFPEG